MDCLGKRRPLAKNATGAAALKRFNRCLGSMILSLVGDWTVLFVSTARHCIGECRQNGTTVSVLIPSFDIPIHDSELVFIMDNLDGCGTSNYH